MADEKEKKLEEDLSKEFLEIHKCLQNEDDVDHKKILEHSKTSKFTHSIADMSKSIRIPSKSSGRSS